MTFLESHPNPIAMLSGLMSRWIIPLLCFNQACRRIISRGEKCPRSRSHDLTLRLRPRGRSSADGFKLTLHNVHKQSHNILP